MSESPVLMSLQKASLGYPGREVLRGVDLEIRKGEAISLHGPNGSGKTTLLRTLAGELAPLSGRLHHVLTPGEVSYVPQEESLPGVMPATALEMAAMGLPYAGREATRKGRIWLERLGLEECSRLRFDRLSGGQKQRVLLARAMVCEPCLILLDEVASGLDAFWVKETARLLSREREERSMGIVASVHFDEWIPDARVFPLGEGRVHA